MHGVQGPGGSRGWLAPGRGGAHAGGREVYVRRRILTLLILLLLLALVIPRACQALSGSREDTGSREERGAGAAGTATGAGSNANETGETGTKDATSARRAPFVRSEAGSEDTTGAAATNLTTMIVTPQVTGGDEVPAAQDAAGSPSTAQGAQISTSPGRVASLQAGRRPAAEPRSAPETSRAPAKRPPSNTERAPANRFAPARMAAPVAPPVRERLHFRSGRVARAPVAVEPVPVAPAPVAPAPAPAGGTAFVAGGAPAGGVAPGFGGNTVGAATFNRGGVVTPAVMAGGPRRAVAAPARATRSALF